MEKFYFDGSVFLGQFTKQDEQVRKGCKNVCISASQKEDAATVGVSNDIENARIDQTLWGIEYAEGPFWGYMDRFYARQAIEQREFTDDIEDCSYELKTTLPTLGVNSRLSVATAILSNVSEIYTLYAELLHTNVRGFLSEHHGIEVIEPCAESENAYNDPILEELYRAAHRSFAVLNTDPLARVADSRRLFQ